MAKPSELLQDEESYSEVAGGVNTETDTPPQRYALAAASVLVCLVILTWFARTVPLSEVATFGLTAGTAGAIRVPDLVLPVGSTFFFCAGLALAVAVAAVVVSTGRWRSLPRLAGALGASLSVAAFLVAFLVWAVAGQSLNFLGMLQGALAGAIPILLAALSGVLCERSGVVNIAIEGMMLSAAFTSVVAASVSHSLLVGLLVGIVTGALLAALHAYLAIAYKVDQIVSGTVVNIFSIGMTSYLSARFLQQHGWLNNSGTAGDWAIPGLSRIPVVGPLLFANNPFFFGSVFLVLIIHFTLFRTKLGLRTRAVGEHPRAADTLGINVFRVRYLSVIAGGAVAGLGGTYFTLGSVGRFDEVMTAGKGFIGLAAMIFGRWTPLGSLLASLLFGFADALQTKLQILFIPIPSEFLLMIPYLVTMVVLSGLVGKATPPAADGEPYER